METIEISKCCQSKVDEVNDAIGDYVLTACRKCGQECQTESVCADCEGSGTVWEGRDDDIQLIQCICQPSKAEKLGEELFELERGN